MMISQPAWICLEATWQRLWRRPILDVDAGHVPETPPAPVARETAQQPELTVAAAEIAPETDPDRPSANPGAPVGPLSAVERRARAAL